MYGEQEGEVFMKFKKYGIILAALLIAVMCCGMACAATKTVYVDANYSGSDSNGTKAKPYKTIKDGYEQIASDDTLHIAPATYTELNGDWSHGVITLYKDMTLELGSGDIIVNKQVYPKPSETGTFVLKGQGMNNSTLTLNTAGSTVIIGDRAAGDGALNKTGKVVIENLRLSVNTASGDYLLRKSNSAKVSEITLKNIHFEAAEGLKVAGIYFRSTCLDSYVDKMTVEGCSFKNITDSTFYLQGVNNLTMRNCSFNNSSVTAVDLALRAFDKNETTEKRSFGNIVIEGCTFDKCGTSKYPAFAVRPKSDVISVDIRLNNNKFTNNSADVMLGELEAGESATPDVIYEFSAAGNELTSLVTVNKVNALSKIDFNGNSWNKKASPIVLTPISADMKLSKDVVVTEKLTAASTVSGDSIVWSTSRADVAKVDANGTVTAQKAGIAVITAKGSYSNTSATCTITVKDSVSPDPVPTPEPVKPEPVKIEDNPVTKDSGTPENVKPAFPEVKAYTTENINSLAVKSGIAAENLVSADGQIAINPVIAKAALEYVMSDDSSVTGKTVATFPIVTAAVSDDMVAAMAFKMTGAQLGAKEGSVVSDITFIKVLKDGTGAKFEYTADATKYADKSCVLKNAEGKTLALTDKILPAETYTFVAFVKDNGSFDYASAKGVVIDPIMAATAEAKPANKHSSSGCNTGLAALALLALVPVIYRRKK